MDCLKRAIKIADICMNNGKNLYLFAHILNKYLYYFSIDADFITADDINNLIELIKEQIDQASPDDQAVKDAVRYLKNTKEAIKARQNDQTPKYKALNMAIL